MSNECRETGTVTDLCYDSSQTEVELVSLIEEQIPRYVLRADTLTDFAGYDNADWIRTPCLPLDTDLDLTPELIEETFKYFILCAERVGQMTKTYNDIEAVTRLLEEKERDLELAARIGQTLLAKNKEIHSRNDELEENLTESKERVRQLSHELSMKNNLLHVYTQDDELYDGQPDLASPDGALGPYPYNMGFSKIDNLTKKMKVLEEENSNLRDETLQLKDDTTELEEKEQQMVKLVLGEISDANYQIKMMQEELSDKTEVSIQQQEEITNLMGKAVMLEAKVKKMALENAELQQHLNAAVESQRHLTSELADLTDKYHECLAMLHETQEEMKTLERRKNPRVARSRYGMYNPFLPEGSLASELEDSLKREMEYPQGYSPDERKHHSNRVMETARAVRRRRRSRGVLSTSPTSGGESGAGSSLQSSMYSSQLGGSNRSSMYLSDDYSESEADSSYGSIAPSVLDKVGIPGSNDLETALRRLSMRKANEINEQLLREEEERQRKRTHTHGSSTPTGSHTPESLLSTGSGSNISDFSRLSGLRFRIPEKLQIVKPLEGSLTLHQWQRLATPDLGGFLDPRPGVQNKGQRTIDVDEEDIYDLSDIEEDSPDWWNEETLTSSENDFNNDFFESVYKETKPCIEKDYEHPGNRPDWTNGTYTYTTSCIMHPSDQYDTTSVTNMYNRGPTMSSQSGGMSFPPPSSFSTPTAGPVARHRAPSMRDSCASTGTTTFSMSMGLATQLKERGIEAKIPKKRPPNIKANSPLGLMLRQPQRFESIVSDTVIRTRQSQTEAVYSSALRGVSKTAKIMLTPFEALRGVSNTAKIMLNPEAAKSKRDKLQKSPEKGKDTEPGLENIAISGPIERALSNTAQPLIIPGSLNLLDKIKETGLDKSGSTTAAQVVLNTGLNMMSSGSREGLLKRMRKSHKVSVVERSNALSKIDGQSKEDRIMMRKDLPVKSNVGLGLIDSDMMASFLDSQVGAGPSVIRRVSPDPTVITKGSPKLSSRSVATKDSPNPSVLTRGSLHASSFSLVDKTVSKAVSSVSATSQTELTSNSSCSGGLTFCSGGGLMYAGGDTKPRTKPTRELNNTHQSNLVSSSGLTAPHISSACTNMTLSSIPKISICEANETAASRPDSLPNISSISLTDSLLRHLAKNSGRSVQSNSSNTHRNSGMYKLK